MPGYFVQNNALRFGTACSCPGKAIGMSQLLWQTTNVPTHLQTYLGMGWSYHNRESWVKMLSSDEIRFCGWNPPLTMAEYWTETLILELDWRVHILALLPTGWKSLGKLFNLPKSHFPQYATQGGWYHSIL